MSEQLPQEQLFVSHFTSKPLGEVVSTEQKPRYDKWSAHDKPRGLWLSVDGDDDWKSWCESESFGIGALRYRVVLRSLDRILFLRDATDILAFTERYGIDSRRYSFPDVAIDWSKVAAEHAGIVIAPYCWELRLDERTNWYYGWDCASGCIWDASIVERIEQIRESEAA